MGKIKVLVVTGTLSMSKCLKNILQADPDIMIAAEANNAYMARDKIIECSPDVMILCNDLQGMPGITFLKKLMSQRHMLTLMIAEKEHKDAAYKGGARDFVECGNTPAALEHENICMRVRKLVEPGLVQPQKELSSFVSQLAKSHRSEQRIIAIGASTGGTEAIARVVRDFKKDLPGSVAVLHMPEGYTQLYARRLNNESEVTVKEAQSGDTVRRGQLLLAPSGRQMRIVRINDVYQVECRVGPRVSGHCPSVDVLFESVAHIAGKNAIGVLLTGMGSDGANGLLAMRKAGAHTIGQNEKTCVVYGMPKVAYEIGAVEAQVSLDQITQRIYSLLENG